jgi:hypothetical protein
MGHYSLNRLCAHKLDDLAIINVTDIIGTTDITNIADIADIAHITDRLGIYSGSGSIFSKVVSVDLSPSFIE